MRIREIQEDVKSWAKHNFADRTSVHPLLGVVEEVGELCHAVLKRMQGIRTNEDHDANERDAIGDIAIYLLDYCSARELDFEEVVNETWTCVKQRDWKANPVKGQVHE